MAHYWDSFADVADRAAFRQSSFTARDGCRLDLYECGSAASPPCIILPPPGVPFLVMARLALALARSFRVISWDTRGSPFVPQAAATRVGTIEDHALDIGEIAALLGLETTRVVTWCESFNLLPHVQQLTPLRVLQAANISPAVYDTRHRTPAGQANEAFIVSILAADATAREYYENYRMLRGITLSGLSPAERTLSDILALSLADFDSARSFAGLCHQFQASANRKLSLQAANTIDSLFLHSQDDKVLHYKGTLAFLEQLERGKLVLHRTGGHHALFHAADATGRDIVCFFDAEHGR